MTLHATTWLFVPGTAPERFDKAVAAGPGAVILDLEDSVRPDLKADARAAVVDWLSSGGAGWVRVNGRGTPWHADDLAQVAGTEGLEGIVLPKAEDGQAVRDARHALGRDRPVLALIESAAGVHRAVDIAGAGAARLAFGNLDFSLDVGSDQSWDALLLARSSLVLASRVHGLPSPVDGVTPDVRSPALAASDARRARTLGFGAKLCIHPAQVAPVAEAFSYSDAEREWAREVVARHGQSAGIATDPDGRMIDQPVVDRAHVILRD